MKFFAGDIDSINEQIKQSNNGVLAIKNKKQVPLLAINIRQYEYLNCLKLWDSIVVISLIPYLFFTAELGEIAEVEISENNKGGE